MTQCISVWYGNSSNQDCKALQRVVRLAERISGSALPSLQDIYLKRCKSRAVKIIKDSNHPGNRLFMYILCVRIPYNCTVHGADLTNISLLVILCIIVYVTNKILNLEIRSTLLKGVLLISVCYLYKRQPVHRSNQSNRFQTLHHGQDQRAVQGCQGQDCRPTQGWNGLQDHRQAAW